MIGFFKNLFNKFFKKKPTPKSVTPHFDIKRVPVSETKMPEITQLEKVKMAEKAVEEKEKSIRKEKYIPGMKGNRLHIEYSGDSGKNGFNSFIHAGKMIKAGSMYKGRIDSLRCTNIERAKRIVGRFDQFCIERAIFKSAGGQEFKII